MTLVIWAVVVAPPRLPWALKAKADPVEVAEWKFWRARIVWVVPEATTVTVVVPSETVEEAANKPLTWRLLETVEEAWEMKPLPTVIIPVVEALVRVVTPVMLRVPEAMRLAKLRFPENKAFPWTDRSWGMVEVPMPNLPELSTTS